MDICAPQKPKPPLVIGRESNRYVLPRASSNSCGFEQFPVTDDHESRFDRIWNYALFMAGHGFRVFPLKKRDKTPLFNGWRKKATSDEGVVLDWARRYPDNNYGVVTGDDLFVIDFDLDESDDINEEIRKVQEKLGSFEPGTLVKTGRGYQLYCSRDGFEIRNNCQKRLTDKVDIKGTGGYVVGPGSIHPNGRHYEFVDPRTLEDGIKLTMLSEAALRYIVSLQGRRRAIGADDDTCVTAASSPENQVTKSALGYTKPIPVGERNDTLFRVGCHHREVNRLQRGDIYAILKEININDCKVPLSDSELSGIAESCCTYAPGTPRPSVEPLTNKECSAEVDNLQAVTDLLSEEDQALFRDNRLVGLAQETIQQFHLGDTNVIALELASAVSMSIQNSKGIFPHLDGDSGKGKTHATLAVLHILPSSMYFMTSFSSKALYYSNKLKEKMVIFSDDTTLSEDQEELIRTCMTNWDNETSHLTLDSQRKPMTLTIPRRVTFWFTAVRNKGTIQLLNRQVTATIDDSAEQDKKVQEFVKRKAAVGLPDFYLTQDVEKLRRAFAHINNRNFSVVIPFAPQIEFKDVENRRNLKIFFDLVMVFAVMNYKGRETDYYGNIIAARQDYETALGVFKAIEEQQVTKLSKPERLVLDQLRQKGISDLPGLREATGLGYSSIYELLHGDKNRKTEGLLDKVSEMRFFSRHDFDPATSLKFGRNHYALDKTWEPDKFCDVVSWTENSYDYGLEVRLCRKPSDNIGNKFRHDARAVQLSNLSLDGSTSITDIHTTLTSDISEEDIALPGSEGAVTPSADIRYSDVNENHHSTRGRDSIIQQKGGYGANLSASEAAPMSSDAADEPQDVSQIPQLIHDCLIDVKQQHHGKKLRRDLLRSMVANKVKDLSNDRYSEPTILDYYDRLNSNDARISALINTICGGEP